MSFRTPALAAAGVGLVCLAASSSSAGIEQALGRAPGSLAWGPALFRVLLGVHGAALVVWAWGRLRGWGQGGGVAGGQARPGTPAWHWAAMAALTALALGLRLWRLNSSLWFDEVLTLLDFARPPLGTIVSSFQSQNQHMLYSVLAHLSIEGLGESAAALRLPAVLFGVASLWALFLLGRRVAGVSEALAACALMTVSYHHIWFSQNARGYTGLLLFATLATWLWLEAVDRGEWRWWMGYAIAVWLGLWTNLTMVFVLAAHGLLYLVLLIGLARGAAPRAFAPLRPVAGWLVAAGLTLQTYALALPEFFRTALGEVSPPSEWTNPMWAVAESLRSLRMGWSGAVVVSMGAALLCGGLLSMVRRDWRVPFVLVVPGVAAAAAILASGHNLWPRFLFFSMGFALLAAVRGAMTVSGLVAARLAARPALASGAGSALVGVMVAASALTVPKCYALPKQDFTGARDYVERNRGPVDGVVTVGLAGKAYKDYFAPQWRVASHRAELDQLRQRDPNIWLVYTLPAQIRGFQPELWGAIERDFQVMKVFPGTLGGGEINVCRVRTEQAAREVGGIQP